MPKLPSSRQHGFTLVELITVIVLLGIVSVGTFAYLGFGAQIFTDVVGREQMSAQSRFAMERLSRELRNAIPNSPRTFANNGCIEFLPISASSTYLSIARPGENDRAPIVMAPADTDTTGSTLPDMHPSQITGHYLFIAANTEQRLYGASSQRRMIESIDVDQREWQLTLNDNAPFPRQSPAHRYYTSQGPVSWCVEGSQLVRYDSYPLATTPALANAQRVMMGSELTAPEPEVTPFRVEAAVLQRNNLVMINLYFARREGQEPMIFRHEVHLPNVP